RSARHVRRGGQKGRVVVLNGIMGARLAVAEDGSEAREIWLRLLRLIGGGFSSLQLQKEGKPNARFKVTATALLKDYIPLVLELHREWNVLPYPFDWRRDLRESAKEFDQRVRNWAGKEPVHIVAHSMGGLLARAFIMDHPKTWAALADTDGLRRGGRLVMLGTPNRGSFAIPYVLTGRETLVKALAFSELGGSLDDVLSVLGTFPGIYQMLPSPILRGLDHRDRLFERKSYAGKHVASDLLALGATFHKDLEPVVDPERFVYIAGYNQKTPYRIRIDGPSDFKYSYTHDGDGRVPHELGLLPDVPTLWVEESHGALPKSAAVLEGIHDILTSGRSDALEAVRPMYRGPTDHRFLAPEHAKDENAEGPTSSPRKRRRAAAGTVDAAEVHARERLALRGWTGAVPREGTFTRDGTDDEAAASGDPLTLPVEVWWGNIQRVVADAYVCGHYENVLPRAAEAALDELVSAEDAAQEERLLFQLTQRGLLPGDLGIVHLYPWANARFIREAETEAKGRIVALAGMGPVGEFEPRHLRTLSRNLTWVLGSLENVQTVASVVIGSGTGNLDLRTSVTAMLEGVDDALRVRTDAVQISRLIFVERELGRARRLHAHLCTIAEARKERGAALLLDLAPRVTIGTEGSLSETDVLEEALCEIAAEARSSGLLGRLEKRLIRLVGETDGAGRLAAALTELRKSVDEKNEFRAGRLQVKLADDDSGSDKLASTWSDRLACIAEKDNLAVSILTSAAIVPKRVNETSWSVFEEAMDKLVDPPRQSALKYGGFVMQQLFEADVRAHLGRESPIVFEVDRRTASLPWELLATEGTEAAERRFLALRRSVARQLRTEYAAPISASRSNDQIRHVLIIGDPGAPELGDSLDGARREALAVYTLLKKLNPSLKVSLLIGAESVARGGELAGTKPATRVEVLSLLMRGDVDLVHYAGHGDFDDTEPTRRGWLFAGRNRMGALETQYLTARELYGIGAPPRLIVANACLSGLTSQRTAAGRLRPGGRDLALLPSLADEFFRRGVRHYIGTAWPVSDLGAVIFAERFYTVLMRDNATVGEAVLAGRLALAERAETFDELWSAYQHYGDPTQRLHQLARQRGQTGAHAVVAAAPAREGKKPRARKAKTKTAKRGKKRLR
ncbi:MAG: CHAT domain-containing protein, partial [Gemmatimonadaceae bacterium]